MIELEDIKTVGFKQMHQLQIDAIIDYGVIFYMNIFNKRI